MSPSGRARGRDGRALAATLAVLCLGAGGAAAQATDSSRRVDPSWLTVNAKKKTAEFQLIAGLTGLNGALNFNGFRDGGVTLTVPKGWHVIVAFRNNDSIPHSAEVIADTHDLPAGPAAPVFPRAFTVRLAQGIPAQGVDTMRFVADRVGSYLIFCGVPNHGTQGMWLRLRVAEKGRPATLTATPPNGP